MQSFLFVLVKVHGQVLQFSQSVSVFAMLSRSICSSIVESTVKLSWTCSQRLISSLVIGEHLNGELAPNNFQTVSASQQFSGDVDALLCGSQIGKTAEKLAQISGIRTVHVADDECLKHQLVERYAELLVCFQQKQKYDYIIAPSSTFGKDLLPRAAALLEIQPHSDIVQILDGNTFVRPIYAGNVLQTFRCKQEGVKMLTIRPSAFDSSQVSDKLAEIQNVPEEVLQAAKDCKIYKEWVGESQTGGEHPDLSSAKVVIAGGRALKNQENFQMLYELADLLGGAVGGTRAAVDAGYISNDLQIGQTGKVIAPQLYIGIGVSGAIQHVAGIKDAGTIVAINKDDNAPIFSIADYGLKQDLFEALPDLITEVKRRKKQSANQG